MSVKHVQELINQVACGEGSKDEIVAALEGLLDLHKSHTHTLKSAHPDYPRIPYEVKTETEVSSDGG